MPKKTLALPTPSKTMHRTNPKLLKQPILIALVGCGGNGSQMLTKLARLHYTLCLLHQNDAAMNPGIMVAAFDPDRVTRANMGRQLFSPADVGHYKSTVLVNRINQYFGTDWVAFGEAYADGVEMNQEGLSFKARPNIIVSCVDSAKARCALEKGFSDAALPNYWLDLGNSRDSGQVILGEPAGEPAGEPDGAQRLPTVLDLFPQLREEGYEEDMLPSCSVAEALDKQSLFVNDHITTWAALLLDNLLRKGELEHHGYFVNLETGRVNPLPVPSAQKVIRLPEAREVAA